MGRKFEGQFDARGKKIAIVGSRFNDFFTNELMNGALDCLHRHGVDDENISVHQVPRSFLYRSYHILQAFLIDYFYGSLNQLIGFSFLFHRLPALMSPIYSRSHLFSNYFY